MKPMSNDELTKHAIRTSADILELNEKIDDVRSVQDAHTERFDRIDGRLDGFKGRLDGFKGRLDGFEGRLDGFEGRLGRVEERLGHVEVRLDRVEERLGRVEVRLDRVEERLGRVEERLDAHIAVSEDHFRRTDANLIEIRGLLGKLIAKGG